EFEALGLRRHETTDVVRHRFDLLDGNFVCLAHNSPLIRKESSKRSGKRLSRSFKAHCGDRNAADAALFAVFVVHLSRCVATSAFQSAIRRSPGSPVAPGIASFLSRQARGTPAFSFP